MTLVWPLWVLSIIGATIGSFAWLESYALKNDKDTFSRFVWTLTANQPWIVVLFVGILAFILGFLACHFWWGGIVSFAPVKKVLQ